MDWIEKMNLAINYIEENITDKLNTDEIAEVAGLSSYHFQRMFACMVGLSLSEYIRRRRMTLAAVDLKNNEASILDIALKYGYNSPTSFNRAFQSVHGIAPSLIKHDGVSIKSYPQISFQITVQGVESLQFRIEEKEAFRVVGVSVPLEKELENNDELIRQLWKVTEANGTQAKLIELMDGELKGILAVMVPDENIEEWRYFVAVASTKEIDDTLEEYLVSPYTWAIFSEEYRADEVPDIAFRAIKEWLPTSGYEYDNGPDIESYPSENNDNSTYEFYLPIRKIDKRK